MNNRRTEEQGIIFERLPNGDVGITDHYAGQGMTVIESNIWASIVLTMTAFNERPNDWHRFMEHHQGTRDILSLTHPWNCPCKVPPPGWRCTRGAGHEGPCAAIPIAE